MIELESCGFLLFDIFLYCVVDESNIKCPNPKPFFK
jgi:hypothetical protein